MGILKVDLNGMTETEEYPDLEITVCVRMYLQAVNLTSSYPLLQSFRDCKTRPGENLRPQGRECNEFRFLLLVLTADLQLMLLLFPGFQSSTCNIYPCGMLLSSSCSL